ncbi:DeoR/GlpR family transcriptional regulator of sugar metabolism [Bacillus thermophilus]|uniref:DeoR/GlpR family transcriptional regulator of sugar metabolism n=1 Tax=Siminovitchia thermophila TaxID=1245522 RepID=A0ABS2RA98_9BACI|nr:DeoR/GlpR family DNA-binding transcription regulator [Siminovitchia thermophila]MBM7716588.1 DeoR/GlpR family transcriptional regulator of sugar metabolism [Siminovitchia thermophila]
MNKEERHMFIVKQLEVHDKVLVMDLANVLNVTPETIRRDLAELEMNEQLTRIHGGAVPFIPTQREMIYEKKMSLYLEEKKRIAKRAAELIQHGDTIALDLGTTTVHIADMIEDVQSLTVVTNSLSAAIRFNLALEERRISGQVIMLPGITNPYQASVKGTATVEFLKRFNFTRAFISCGGFTTNAIYDFDMDESLVSETMIQCSKESILLADASKFNKRSNFKICPLSNISTVICNEEKPVEWDEQKCAWIMA